MPVRRATSRCSRRADGAPEAWLDGRRCPVSISLSHRAGRALAAVARRADAVMGCDLELIEPRSGAFVREWLAPAEQRLVGDRDGRERALLANLIWTAKEAAAKVRREGLRLDVRHAVVTLGGESGDAGGGGSCGSTGTAAPPRLRAGGGPSRAG